MIDIDPTKYNKGPISVLRRVGILMSSLSIYFIKYFYNFVNKLSSRRRVVSLTAYQQAEIFDEKYFTNWDGRSRECMHTTFTIYWG